MARKGNSLFNETSLIANHISRDWLKIMDMRFTALTFKDFFDSVQNGIGAKRLGNNVKGIFC